MTMQNNPKKYSAHISRIYDGDDDCVRDDDDDLISWPEGIGQIDFVLHGNQPRDERGKNSVKLL